MKKEQAMTTVINFNLLNFVRLQQNSVTVNSEVHAHAHYSQNGKNIDPGQEPSDVVIDITPYKPALADTRLAHQRRTLREIPVTSRVDNLYNRSGRVIQNNDSKGLLIDSYV